MPLQILFRQIAGKHWSESVDHRRIGLQRPGDWNTYLNKGLPPTPISMPSAASIEAAAHPEPSKYLYFVSRGDGTSEFSTNLRDHNRAVNRFILKRGAPAKSVQTDKPASAAKAPQNASKPASVE